MAGYLDSVWARLKGIGGGTDRPIPTIASATLLSLDGTSNTFIISGSTAITKIDPVTPIRPGRVCYFHTSDTTGPAWTDTAYASKANGTVSLSAALTQAKGTTLTLQQTNDGSWFELARAANG